MKINRSKVANAVYFLIFYNLFFGTLSMLGVPDTLKYLNDIILLYISIWLIPNIIYFWKEYNSKVIFIIIIFFMIVCIITSIINLVNPLLVVWACRNVFRFLILYLAVTLSFTKDDVELLFKDFYKIQWINILVTAYQFLVLDLNQDRLGGIFGIAVGCNAGTNIFFCILLIREIVAFLSKKTSLKSLVFILSSTMIIAALAELKIYYIEFVVIILAALLIMKPNRKTIGVILVSTLGLLIGLEILKNIFPMHYQVLTNAVNFVEYANMQGGGYNISRFNAFDEINHLFFKDNTLLKLFGYGFGACEYSGFDFLVSDFYRWYGRYNYRWFMHQMLFLETGYVGLVSYVAIYVGIGIQTIKVKFNHKNNEHVYFSIIFVLICMVQIVYNSLFRIEYAYFVMPFLAIGSILLKEKDEKKN